jgi:hypothetical protein
MYLFRCARLNGRPLGENSLSQEVGECVCGGGGGGCAKCPWAHHMWQEKPLTTGGEFKQSRSWFWWVTSFTLKGHLLSSHVYLHSHHCKGEE